MSRWCGEGAGVLRMTQYAAITAHLLKLNSSGFVMSRDSASSDITASVMAEHANSILSPAVSGILPERLPRREPMRRVLIVAYTHYIFDARVKRHAEALSQQGYAVDVICLADAHEQQRLVNVIGVPGPRYRGRSRAEYLRQYLRFFAKATYTAAKLNRKQRYDVVIVC